MKINKIAQMETKKPDFTSSDVRRLAGLFTDFQDLSESALKEMDKWLENGEQSIDFEEAKTRLGYYLDRMGLR
jgi:hypothetical protein